MLVVAAKVVLSNCSRPINGSSGPPSRTNHTCITVSRCRQCAVEVVIHSTNGHLVYITRSLSVSNTQAFLRAFYTVQYIDDAKRRLYTFEKYSLVLPYKEGDVMLNGSSGERSQSPEWCLAWLWKAMMTDYKETF